MPPSFVRRGRVSLWERYDRDTARRYATRQLELGPASVSGDYRWQSVPGLDKFLLLSDVLFRSDDVPVRLGEVGAFIEH